jgi:hypothetical protein
MRTAIGHFAALVILAIAEPGLCRSGQLKNDPANNRLYRHSAAPRVLNAYFSMRIAA